MEFTLDKRFRLPNLDCGHKSPEPPHPPPPLRSRAHQFSPNCPTLTHLHVHPAMSPYHPALSLPHPGPPYPFEARGAGEVGWGKACWVLLASTCTAPFCPCRCPHLAPLSVVPIPQPEPPSRPTSLPLSRSPTPPTLLPAPAPLASAADGMRRQPEELISATFSREQQD